MKLEKQTLTILNLIKKRPMTNKDIVKELGILQTAVSRSLSILRKANLIDFKPCSDRRNKLYSINENYKEVS